MSEMLGHRNLSGVDCLRSRCLYCAQHVAGVRADECFSTTRLFGRGLGMSKFFLAMIVVALGTLIGLFAFVALTV